MNTKDMTKAQGHWILAKMGKKVLRPGGKELTLKMIETLNINSTDEVTEFGPGIGETAKLVLKKNPRTYCGVEVEPQAVRDLRKVIDGKNKKIIFSSAAESKMGTDSMDKVFGEAILSMLTDFRKSEIIEEAHRILKKGGLYAIHEIRFLPEDITDELKTEITRELALSIRVNTRPLTKQEWTDLLEEKGFKVLEIHTSPMSFLETKRIIKDEGIIRTIKIGLKMLINRKARKRIFAMKKVYRTYSKHLQAIVLVAEKT
jgi:phospholipid N-methyltransferase